MLNFCSFHLFSAVFSAQYFRSSSRSSNMDRKRRNKFFKKWRRNLNKFFTLPTGETNRSSSKRQCTIIKVKLNVYNLLSWCLLFFFCSKFSFDNGVVGKALKGPICTYEYSGGVNTDHSPVIGLVATTIAHEMGHNFGKKSKTYKIPIAQ